MSGFPEGYAWSDEFFADVRAGNVAGYSIFDLFGKNPACGNTEEDMWYPGGTFNWLNTAASLEAISASAADTASGAGARTVKVTGLDGNFDEINETITMNGQSASTATTKMFIRVNLVEVVTVGTYTASNTGDITIRVSGGGSTLEVVQAGVGRSQSGRYCTPSGKMAHLRTLLVTVESSGAADVIMYIRENADDALSVPFTSRIAQHYWHGVKGALVHDMNYLRIPPKADVWFATLNGGGSTKASADCDLLVMPMS